MTDPLATIPNLLAAVARARGVEGCRQLDMAARVLEGIPARWRWRTRRMALAGIGHIHAAEADIEWAGVDADGAIRDGLARIRTELAGISRYHHLVEPALVGDIRCTIQASLHYHAGRVRAAM